jgi:hypothetical protein
MRTTNRIARAIQHDQPGDIDLADIFRERCAVAALAYASGASTLLDAVDDVQHYAIKSGLLAEIGQDGVQAIMAAAFAPDRVPSC